MKTTENTVLAIGIAFLLLLGSPDSLAGPLEVGPNLVSNGSFEATRTRRLPALTG